MDRDERIELSGLSDHASSDIRSDDRPLLSGTKSLRDTRKEKKSFAELLCLSSRQGKEGGARQNCKSNGLPRFHDRVFPQRDLSRLSLEELD